jgi:uncharacterized protein (TIGR01319 family)
MSTTIVNADSILAIDVGSVNTRAILFDVVEGRYRFVACGVATTTIHAPLHNISIGIQKAIQELQTITGRVLNGVDGSLITPAQQDGSGVDRCVATLSGGPILKTIVVGLLEEVSVQSALNLAASSYTQVQEVISLNDRRKASERMDAIIRIHPDLVIIAGGTEQGASQSVHSLIDAIGLACYLLPKGKRPQVIYAGNQALAGEVKSLLGAHAPLAVAPNIRPTLELENLLPAQKKMAGAFREAWGRAIPGTAELNRWAGDSLLPTALAFGRTIRFISREYAATRKGVLGVDIGATSTTIAAGFAGDLHLTVHPRMGTGEGSVGVLLASSLEEITRWLECDIEDDQVRDYIYNKSLQPASLPVTPEELAIEHALATQALYVSIRKAIKTFPEKLLQTIIAGFPTFEPIIATGSTLGMAPQRGQTLMMLLNALQPGGITTFAIDQNNLAAALGAAAEFAPLLTVQAMDASNFSNLCTVISPVGKAPLGTPILRLRIRYSEGNENTIDIKNGTLEVVSIPFGQVVNVQLQPLHRFDVGMGGAGRGGSVKIMGGTLGLVIDSRGRPLRLPEEPERRREQIQKWHWTVRS